MLAIDRSIALVTIAVAFLVGIFVSAFQGNRARRYSESAMQIQAPSLRQR